jgi:aldose 1-epimerase
LIIILFLIENSQEKIIVKEEKSRRVMTISTNQPGMVMYTGNSLEKGWKLVEGESKSSSSGFLTSSIVPKFCIKANEPYQKLCI